MRSCSPSQKYALPTIPPFIAFKELEEERKRMKEASERVLSEKEALLAPLSNEKSEEEMMAEMMGFSNFDTTQNKGFLQAARAKSLPIPRA